jgi:hypothetical protein
LRFKHRNVGIWKRDSEHYIPLPFGEKGIADIIACSPEGRFWAIEVKKPGGKPSSDQISFLNFGWHRHRHPTFYGLMPSPNLIGAYELIMASVLWPTRLTMLWKGSNKT